MINPAELEVAAKGNWTETFESVEPVIDELLKKSFAGVYPVRFPYLPANELGPIEVVARAIVYGYRSEWIVQWVIGKDFDNLRPRLELIFIPKELKDGGQADTTDRKS